MEGNGGMGGRTKTTGVAEGSCAVGAATPFGGLCGETGVAFAGGSGSLQ